MAVSFKYWNDCVDPQEMEALWMDPEVRKEWIAAGETKGQKVHMSRDPDGQPYLTQTEMKAVAIIIVRRHFVSQVDTDMIRALAELESNRQPTATRYNKKTKETTIGVMQILPKTADWLVGELNYRVYDVKGKTKLLYRPFVNIYLGAAYLKWLLNHDNKEKNEEFIIRAYVGGVKKAAHKSTLEYWKRYLSVKESLPSRKVSGVVHSLPIMKNPSNGAASLVQTIGETKLTWDSKTSPKDMEAMWNHPTVSKEWTKVGGKKGSVKFAYDSEKRPYLSRIELRAVADIVLSRYFSKKPVIPAILCALSEIVSMRFVQGVGPRPGILGIDFPTACWLYKDLDYKAYNVESVDDLTNPFASMYFGAAYLNWLSEYEGSERSPQFVIQAYLSGPKNANLDEKSPNWQKFEEALGRYEEIKKGSGSCIIL